MGYILIIFCYDCDTDTDMCQPGWLIVCKVNRHLVEGSLVSCVLMASGLLFKMFIARCMHVHVIHAISSLKVVLLNVY